MKRYEQLADSIAGRIAADVLRPGDRLPSIRQASRAHAVSPGTVQMAYQLLEDRGAIRTRPRSGYYVNARTHRSAPEPDTSAPPDCCTEVNVSDLVFEILDTARNDTIVQLGSAFIDFAAFPLAKLARAHAGAARRLEPRRMVEDLPPGNQDLRRAIARRYNACGVELDIDDIVITSGGLDALNLCLQTVTRPGDTVAIESPAFYAALQAIERLGLRAVELRTHPRDGVDPGALAEAIARHPIRACWLMPSFQNPLGATMPPERKRALVELLARHEIPLIEDDVYGELHFGDDKPRPAKAWDRAGLVLHCASFSKCLAPGYRVGWAAPGRYARDVARMKIMTTLSAGIPAQAAIAEYLTHGGYERHLRTLRRDLETRCALMTAAITRHFPDNTCVTRPSGGYFLWLYMPGIDALTLHRAALAEGISIAPGPIFSPTRQFGHCMRLNFGQPWNARTEAAIATLGRLVAAMGARAAALEA